MSWDLRVATTEPFERDLLREWCSAHEVVLEPGGVDRPSGEPVFLVGGAAAVEAEDLDPHLADAVPGAAWELAISVPLGFESAETRELATSLARFVAERRGGAVLDPQRDRVVWPTGHVPKPVPREEIDTIELRWYATAERVRAAGPAFLSAARRWLPPAVPRRYGALRPSRFDAADPTAFLDAWRTARDPFTWQPTAPCYLGMANRAGLRRDDGARPAGLVSLSIDRRAGAAPELREGVVALLVELAAAIEAFYAVASVRRGVVLSRGRVGRTGDSEELDLPESSWFGLPARPSWLTWYGAPYAALLAPWLGDRAEPRAGGLLARRGLEPADADELAARVAPLPEALVGSRLDRRPAAHIPEL